MGTIIKVKIQYQIQIQAVIIVFMKDSELKYEKIFCILEVNKFKIVNLCRYIIIAN